VEEEQGGPRTAGEHLHRRAADAPLLLARGLSRQ
jgi:hypothetical protein